MLITIEVISGDMVAIAPAHVTHLTPNNLGTQIHFVSGESIITTKRIGELTLDLMSPVS